jgi:hypothetical protein
MIKALLHITTVLQTLIIKPMSILPLAQDVIIHLIEDPGHQKDDST